MNPRALLPRGWPGGFVAAFLALQLALPLEYYACRDDAHDERFAWRMFSPERMVQCAPTFLVGGERARLDRTFHEAWIELARRGRLAVLEAMGARLCEEHPGKDVRLDLRCKTIEGRVETWGGSDLCKFPEL